MKNILLILLFAPLLSSAQSGIHNNAWDGTIDVVKIDVDTLFSADSTTVFINDPLNIVTSLSIGGTQVINATTLGSAVVNTSITSTGTISAGNGTWSSTIASASVTTTLAWGDGQKQTFNPSSTTAGINFGGLAGDPSSPSDGDVWYDVSGAKFRARENGSSVNLVTAALHFSHVQRAPTSSDSSAIFFTNVAITVTEMEAVLVGVSTPSVRWTILHDADRSATGNEVVTGGTTTTSITTGSIVTSFNDATIPANSWVWFETRAKSGTVAELLVTIQYDED